MFGIQDQRKILVAEHFAGAVGAFEAVDEILAREEAADGESGGEDGERAGEVGEVDDADGMDGFERVRDVTGRRGTPGFKVGRKMVLKVRERLSEEAVQRR